MARPTVCYTPGQWDHMEAPVCPTKTVAPAPTPTTIVTATPTAAATPAASPSAAATLPPWCVDHPEYCASTITTSIPDDQQFRHAGDGSSPVPFLIVAVLVGVFWWAVATRRLDALGDRIAARARVTGGADEDTVVTSGDTKPRRRPFGKSSQVRGGDMADVTTMSPGMSPPMSPGMSPPELVPGTVEFEAAVRLEVERRVRPLKGAAQPVPFDPAGILSVEDAPDHVDLEKDAADCEPPERRHPWIAARLAEGWTTGQIVDGRGQKPGGRELFGVTKRTILRDLDAVRGRTGGAS